MITTVYRHACCNNGETSQTPPHDGTLFSFILGTFMVFSLLVLRMRRIIAQVMLYPHFHDTLGAQILPLAKFSPLDAHPLQSTAYVDFFCSIQGNSRIQVVSCRELYHIFRTNTTAKLHTSPFLQMIHTLMEPFLPRPPTTPPKPDLPAPSQRHHQSLIKPSRLVLLRQHRHQAARL